MVQSTTSTKDARPLVPFILLFIVFLLIGNEQSHAALPEEEFFGEIPEVLTATRLRQPINEAPASMTIIDRQMIEASGARDIADVFRLVPGFQVQHENGHTPIVTYHGMSDQYSRWMQVLVDGRTIYTPSWGGVEWSQIPLVVDEIERIEVTRGPNAASFGSNAFAATINIITKHASDTNGTFLRYTAGVPNNLRDALLQYGNNVNLSNGMLDYRLLLGRLSDDGYKDRYDIMRANLARLRVDYNDGLKNNWLIETGFSNGPRGLDDFGSNDVRYKERDREKDTEYNFQQLRWTHSINSNEEVYIQYFHNYHKVNETNHYFLTADEFGLSGQPQAVIDLYNLDPVDYTLENSLKTNRHDLEIQHTLVPNEDLRIAWGGSIRRDQWYSPGLIESSNTVNVDLSRLFANSEWRVSEKTKINAGGMWENSELTGNSFSPRLGLVHSIDKNNNIRIAASKATRIPTMIEYDGNIIEKYTGQNLTTFYGFPDPSYDTLLLKADNLKHEKITSYEAGINSNHPEYGYSSDLKIFTDVITDIIYVGETTDPLNDISITPVAYTIKNGGKVIISGLEFQSDIKPTTNNRILFTYTITEIKNYEKPSDNNDALYYETASPLSFSLLISHKFQGNLNMSLLMNHTSLYEGLGSGNPVDDYTRADIRFSVPYHINKLKGEISLVLQNISGNEYFDWSKLNKTKGMQMLSITGQFN